MKSLGPIIVLAVAALTAHSASFNTNPSDAFVTTGPGGSLSGNNYAFTYTLGLTPGFTADLLAGDNLSLRLFAADSSVSGAFNSRSFRTAASPPVLTIVAVPKPGTLALAGLGIVLPGGCRWPRGRK